MNIRFKDIGLSFVALVIPACLNADWHDGKCEGWAYHEDFAISKKEEEKTVAENQSYSQSLAQCRQEIEEFLAKAILEPNEDNIRKYIELQNKWLSRSSDFSKLWAKIVLDNPHLDNSLSGIPVSSYGTKFYHKQKSERQKQIVQTVSKTHALVCFYEGKKHESREFSNVINIFSKRYEWVLQPMSVDGVFIDEFENSILDSGLKNQLKIAHFPAVFLINTKTQEVIPIGFGLISVDMLETNVAIQFEETT